MQNSEDKQRTFAFAVLFGFETKNFFGSGLYDALSRQYKSFILRRDFPTQNFDVYVKTYDLYCIIFKKDNTLKKRLKSEAYNLASRRAYKRINHITNFNYFKKDREIKFTDYLLGNKLVYLFLNSLALKNKKKNYFNDELKNIYDQQEMTDLIIAGYSSPEAIALANTAQGSGRNVYLVINSWKDFYVNDFIPFTPTRVFVWSQSMKEQLLSSNSHINPSNVITSGNPSFDRFFAYQPVNPKEYYAQKYRFDVERPVILYSMISPKAYDKEKEMIELINQHLMKKYPHEKLRPVIILRRNPIDETEADESFFSGNNVRYADNYFEGSYENAVFVQLPEGETEWMDLLYHADININVASTVTLEALMMKTPVINVEFDYTGQKNEELCRYAAAPFYKPLCDRNDVVIASSMKTCINAIETFLAEKIIINNLTPILDHFDGNATKRIASEIQNG